MKLDEFNYQIDYFSMVYDRKIGEDIKQTVYSAIAEKDKVLDENLKLKMDYQRLNRQLDKAIELVSKLINGENSGWAEDCQECAVGRSREWSDLKSLLLAHQKSVKLNPGESLRDVNAKPPVNWKWSDNLNYQQSCLKRDAERYRWLRAGGQSGMTEDRSEYVELVAGFDCCSAKGYDTSCSPIMGKELDDEIDKAMKGK